ncbi:hypothetical protein SDRG_14808 [Saprolegnia diclina VS20]|uniref:Uncharacterized protein n=1 Tax=Saprolegnia diclina (strain VS20) TaxID=1156394 RepID=T0PYP9_SAPDV|nr:hypothetical protein SDRG_14808 [Saprolegnia diclina VS20]EQC27366.1 hypothetical protein SDRG_14808 [Saprolegnia diclina VS20]|eukprot:XP_008619185.1 hypothetical protein SDRG_14808 [Saprolegnia diclina VS20]
MGRRHKSMQGYQQYIEYQREYYRKHRATRLAKQREYDRKRRHGAHKLTKSDTMPLSPTSSEASSTTTDARPVNKLSLLYILV